MRKSTYREALNKIYRLVGLGITGAMKTTPTLAMGALLYLILLHIAVEAGARRMAVRLQFCRLWREAPVSRVNSPRG